MKYPLPTRDEILDLLPALYAASGEDQPRPLLGVEGRRTGSPYVFGVLHTLSPAQANPDFEISLEGHSELERAFLHRQIERSHRNNQRNLVWEVRGVSRIVDWTVQDSPELFGLVAFEVPLVSTSRDFAILRGQRCESFGAEDFEHRLRRDGTTWASGSAGSPAEGMPEDDTALVTLLEAAASSLGLREPLRPWWLGEEKPRLPSSLNPILASPLPLPYDLDPSIVEGAFLAEDRAEIRRQLEEGFNTLRVLPMEWGPADRESVRVRFGLPLIGRDRVFLRIQTTNLYGESLRRVDGDFFVWLTPEGTPLPDAPKMQQNMLSRWAIGRSPGLPALLNLNDATEAELLRLPGLNLPKAQAILARRAQGPLSTIEELTQLSGIGPATIKKFRHLVTC
ncbi:MAG: helix-hairpin-helix domain-containing protein [Myxococcota bacterium]